MKQIVIISAAELILSFLLSLWANEGGNGYDLMTIFGLMNLMFAALGAIVAVIMLIAKNKRTGLNVLAAAGIVLLVGAGVCSAFPMKFKMM